MDINPIQGITGVQNLSGRQKVNAQGNENAFRDILQTLINNVKETEAVVNEDVAKLAAGEVDDLHTIVINAEKAELALELLTQVRNKAIDAYNEIMKITL